MTIPQPNEPYVITQPGAPLRTNGLGIASLVIGIIAFVLSFIPFVNYASGFFAFVALILGIVGLVMKGRKKGTAIAGTIISLLALILSIVLAIVYTSVFAAAVNKTVDDENKKANKSITLIYEVTGNSKDASIDYTSFTDDNEGSEQVNDAKLPFSKTLTVKQGGDFDFTSYSLTATNGTTGTTIACTITLDGKVVSHHTGKGKFATALCSYSK